MDFHLLELVFFGIKLANAADAERLADMIGKITRPLQNNLGLDGHTFQKLTQLLQRENKATSKLKTLIASNSLVDVQNSNRVLGLLTYTYHTENSGYPAWLRKFIDFKTNNRQLQVSFVNEYSSLLSFSHIITKMKDKNNNNLIKQYIKDWNASQLEFTKTIRFIDASIEVPEQDGQFIDLEFGGNAATAPDDIKKLDHLLEQYLLMVRNKIKPPAKIIKIAPDKFGRPPIPQRVFNMQLRRLVKLQEYFKKIPPISQSDMDVLNGIDLIALDGNVREAYVDFMSSIFTIDDDGNIAKSNIFEKRVSASEKIKQMYRQESL